MGRISFTVFMVAFGVISLWRQKPAGALGVGDADCAVRDVIKFENLFSRSIQFLAHVPFEGIIFKVKMICSGKQWEHDTFTVTTDSIILDSLHSSVTEHRNWSSPRIEEGWVEIRLEYGDEYSIVDDEGQAWVPERIRTECQIRTIELSDGLFVAFCPERTLKWEIADEKCADVPWSSPEMDMTLASTFSFNPVLHFGEIKMKFGMSGGTLTASSGQGLSPIPPSDLHLRVSFSPEEGQVSVKVLETGQEFRAGFSNTKPSAVLVCRENNNKFMLFLNLPRQEENVETKATQGHVYLDVATTMPVPEMSQIPKANTNNYGMTVLQWSVMVGVIAVVLILLAVVVGLASLFLRLFKTGNVSSSGTGTEATSRTEDTPKNPSESNRSSSEYLEPRRLIQGISSPPTRASPEHLYEEIDETGIVYDSVSGSRDPTYVNYTKQC